METVKKIKGTCKGIIGEAIFTSTRKNVIMTLKTPQREYIPQIKAKIPIEKSRFLQKYWFSLDCIEFYFSKEGGQVILYEVKTRNYLENRPNHWKPCMSKITMDMYKEAINLGFNVKLAEVTLFDNWEFNISIVPFIEDSFHISKPRRYDKKYDNRILVWL